MKILLTKLKLGHSALIKASMACVSALIFSALPLTLQAQSVIADDFESYTDDFDLKFVWPNNQNNGISLSELFNRIPNSGVKSVKISASNDRAARSLGTPIEPGNLTKFTIYTYNTNFITNARIQVGVTHSTSTLSAHLGIGWFNNATAVIDGTADTWDGTKYQGHLSGSGGNFWFNLNNPGTSNRRLGWQKFDIERLPDGVTRFYVDGILGRTATNLVEVSTNSLKSAVIGFGLGTLEDHVWFDGVEVSNNHPEVTVQPQDVTANSGEPATFTVQANNATSYQWRRYTNGVTVTNNYVDIPGATSSTYTIPSVSAADTVGWYAVMVSNENGSIGSRAVKLVINAPYITTQPRDQFVVEGGHATFTATADGAPTLAYQWQFEEVNIAGATRSSLTISNCVPANAGNYRLRVSNSHGNTTSSNAVLTVFANPNPDVMQVLWRHVATAEATNFVRSSGSGARGMAYNPQSNRILVVSRALASTGRVYVMDANTGAFLHELNDGLGIIGGGTFPQSMIAASEDGKVYVANLTLNGTTDPFRLYLYENDEPTTEPVPIYVGDPGAGTVNRWGDSIAIRGSGNDTRILVGSRNGKQFAIIDPNTGSTTTINVTGVGDNEFGLGVAFGAGDTLWAKVNSKPLYHISFDGNVLNVYSNMFTAGPIAVDPVNNLLAVNTVGAAENPDNLRLYSVANLSSDPVLLDFEFYNHPSDNSVAGSFGTGSINFGANGRVYALNENQGIIAWHPVPSAPPVLTLTRNGSNVELSWSGDFKLQSATVVTGPYEDIATTSPYIESSASGVKFFQLISNP